MRRPGRGTGHEARRRAEAELYRRWITERRRLEEIVGQMEQTAAAAAELLLRRRPRRPRRPAQRRTAQVVGYMVGEKCGTSGGECHEIGSKACALLWLQSAQSFHCPLQ